MKRKPTSKIISIKISKLMPSDPTHFDNSHNTIQFHFPIYATTVILEFKNDLQHCGAECTNISHLRNFISVEVHLLNERLVSGVKLCRIHGPSVI
jgi:hypothetical protein